LSALGLGAGWRCWEIGAGGGSIVRWMAAEVGESGSVLGTDLNLDWMTPTCRATSNSAATT
jgi:precorrin-6B methylase 2